MNNSCKNVRLFVLIIAAAIQYVGASAKRQFLYLVKLLIISIPGIKDSLDNFFKPSVVGWKSVQQDIFDGLRNIGDKFLSKIPTDDLDEILTVDQDKICEETANESLETISDFAVDILLWILSAGVSVLSLIGVLIESATGLVAHLLRLICKEDPITFSLREGLKTFIGNIRETTDVLKELTDANIRWRIVPINTENTENSCGATKSDKASAFSFAAQESKYIDSGVRYEFLLNDGMIYYGQRASGIDGLKVVNNPNILTYPKSFPSTGLSFHEFRSGQEINNLRFDMIAASNDRVFAKVEGKPDFYFAVMDEMFVNTGINGKADVPSIYFKLDPEQGKTDVQGSPLDPSSLVGQISDGAGNLIEYPNHPQAERLPFLHSAIGMGLLDAMIVSVKPKTWYRLDTRPPHYGNEISSSNDKILPRDFPTLMSQYTTRPASQYLGTYLSGGGDSVAKGKYEFKFSRVLSLGVGNFHYYESWVEDYGGEIQPLHQSGPFNLSINMSLYGLFNGPIWDGDGACDGTCNFYILVKLDHAKYPTIPDDKYGILWCDEQTYFTKRWRLLDPRDNEPWKIDIPHDINLSLTAALRRDKESGLLNQQYNFDYQRYLMSDPFQRGWINGESRMAVARQIVLVTGNKEDIPTLFSINFSYGSIDRQWRSRSYPKGIKVRTGINPEDALTRIIHWNSAFDHPTRGILSPPHHHINQDLATSSIYPETLHIREDMTISIRGYKESHLGRWFQRYLPCTRQYPKNEFEHPWRFLPEEAFQRADAFSHFGVYDQVDSRNQYYIVEVIEPPLKKLECPIKLQDKDKALSIKGIKFHWGLFKNINDLNNFLDEGDGENHLPKHIHEGSELEVLSKKLFFKWNDDNRNSTYDGQYRKSRTSAHNEFATFKLLDRGPLGYLLVWEDKRDDDLISISDLPRGPITFTLENNYNVVGHMPPRDRHHTIHAISDTNNIKLRILRNKRITSLPNVQNVSLSLLENNTKLQISIETKQNEIDAIENLWAIRIAALPESGNPERIMIYEAESLLKHDDFVIDYDAKSNLLTLEGIINIDASFIDYLDDKGALKHATSVWFEDIVGHVSTPDLIKFQV